MSYAVRSDLKGWRAVSGPDDIGPDEFFSESQPAPVMADPQKAINAEALAYLDETDWYIIRQQETGEPIPDEILSKRAAARKVVVR